MRKRLIVASLGTAALALGTVAVVAAPGAHAASFGYNQLNKVQQRHLSGLLSLELNSADAGNVQHAAPTAPQRVAAGAACSGHFGGNVKVNQNCLNLSDANLQGRAQAQNETWAAADPIDSSHVVASYNDYRYGDGGCGVSYSLDGGRTWADSTAPAGFTKGATTWGAARQYWQGGGDTSVAWDTKGNAYLSCQRFNRGLAASANPDQSSAFYVYRSTGTDGASWNFAGRPVAEHNDLAGAGNVLLDKQLLTVDNHAGSPFQDRVYVTWTTFAADGTAYIYEANSADYGEHFSAPVLVSAAASTCTNTFGLPTPQGPCNQNQFSQPFTAPDGSLYVAYANFNNTVTGNDNRNQMLLAKSTDGGTTFSTPVVVGTYYDLADCATYQGGADAGRACLPEKGPSSNSIFRATNYPIGSVDPASPNKVVVTYGSMINHDSNETTGCTPSGFAPATGINTYTGVKTACANHLLLSVSTNAGATFTGTTTDPRSLAEITTAPGQAKANQYFQGAAFNSHGTLAVSYYDRQYGADENIGFSDITVSTSTNLSTFTHTRATTSSMPPPTQFGGTFYGDYAGVAVTDHAALPVWSDTRPVDLFLCPGTGTTTTPPAACQGGASNASVANDQDIYVAGVHVQ
jgi:hypothetical protein